MGSDCIKEYKTTNYYCRELFGSKVYKLALSAATTCPNRDGTVGYGGCTFCSEGSGAFTAPHNLTIDEQIESGKKLLGEKGIGLKYIAYFQSYTGTYGDLKALERIYSAAAEHPDVVGLSIGTRPDCLGDDALGMLKRLTKKCPLWVELGLQTIHSQTAKRINRCFELDVYETAIEKLGKIPVHRITHIILGLPGETREQMLQTVAYVGERSDGIKLQLLHVLRNTPLAKSYENGEFDVLSLNDYCELVADCLELLPENIVVHRITGDGDAKDLIAPLWSADKKKVLAALNRTLSRHGIKPKQNT